MFDVYGGMSARVPLSKVAAHAQRAEALGYDGLCVPEAVHDGLLAATIPERDDSEVCGNCLEFKVSGGKGRCGLRYLQVGATDPACEYFDMAERGDDDEDDDAEDPGDET